MLYKKDIVEWLEEQDRRASRLRHKLSVADIAASAAIEESVRLETGVGWVIEQCESPERRIEHTQNQMIAFLEEVRERLGETRR